MLLVGAIRLESRSHIFYVASRKCINAINACEYGACRGGTVTDCGRHFYSNESEGGKGIPSSNDSSRLRAKFVNFYQSLASGMSLRERDSQRCLIINALHLEPAAKTACPQLHAFHAGTDFAFLPRRIETDAVVPDDQHQFGSVT